MLGSFAEAVSLCVLCTIEQGLPALLLTHISQLRNEMEFERKRDGDQFS